MANPSQRQGPLDHLGLAARTPTAGDNGIQLTAMPVPSIIELRGTWSEAFATAVQQVIGVAPPEKSPDVVDGRGITVFWMGPDRWWLISDTTGLPSVNELRQNLAAFTAGAVEIGDAFAAITLSGANARDVLSKGCTFDLHPTSFRPQQVVQTNLAKAQVALYLSDDTTYRIYVRRSFAEYMWTWLEDAGMEYGVSVEVS